MASDTVGASTPSSTASAEGITDQSDLPPETLVTSRVHNMLWHMEGLLAAGVLIANLPYAEVDRYLPDGPEHDLLFRGVCAGARNLFAEIYTELNPTTRRGGEQ